MLKISDECARTERETRVGDAAANNTLYSKRGKSPGVGP